MEYRWFYKKSDGEISCKHCIMSDSEAAKDGWTTHPSGKCLTDNVIEQQNEVKEVEKIKEDLTCPVCGKLCGSKVGLVAHMRVHK